MPAGCTIILISSSLSEKSSSSDPQRDRILSTARCSFSIVVRTETRIATKRKYSDLRFLGFGWSGRGYVRVSENEYRLERVRHALSSLTASAESTLAMEASR